MNTVGQSPQSTDVRSLLLPYTLSLVGGMAAVQICIAVTGGEITVLAATLTAIVALGLLIWAWRHRRRLTRVRFGGVIAHTIGDVVGTTSFIPHPAVRVVHLGAGGGIETSADTLLASPWFGATLVISPLWGLGLLLLLLRTVLGHDWEDLSGIIASERRGGMA